MKNSISKGTLALPSGVRQSPEGKLQHLASRGVHAGNGAFPVVCSRGRDGPPFPGPTPQHNYDK
jgi:hypothetical protein